MKPTSRFEGTGAYHRLADELGALATKLDATLRVTVGLEQLGA